MLKFLSGSVTQASADAFATASMATGLANLSLGYRVRGVEVNWPDMVETDCDVQVQILRRVPTALVGITDRTLMWCQSRYIRITTSGQIFYEGFTRQFFERDLELLIVEDPIYISIDSTGTSASNSARVRIYYEEVKLSETAKLAALTESLNA